MSNHFWKNVHLFFSKLKCLPTIQSTPPSPSDQNQDHHNHPSLSTASSIIIKNFNSLYNLTSSQTQHSTSLTSSTTTEFFSSSSDDSDDTDYSPPPPDFATVFASQRFFFSTPGHSNSIVDSTQHPHPPPDDHDHNNTMFLVNESVKVPKYSLDPYVDFRRSMQEMVDARNLNDLTTEWEYLHELLLCYLTLNPKNTHKYIIQAFSDLVICILSSSSSSSSAANHCSESKNRRQQYISQQLL
ncbi:transcription repressor OFP12 [Quercus suber]|uniref:Transcription repressor n=1 Tax=Quercus suber TaxID=58331 RepID=A0AAW0MDP0_QUESU|nr:transcription repressor OFP12-like [Quercus suber]